MEDIRLTEDLANILTETREYVERAEVGCGLNPGLTQGIVEDDIRRKSFYQMLFQASSEEREKLEQVQVLREQEKRLKNAVDHFRQVENKLTKLRSLSFIALSKAATVVGPVLSATLSALQKIFTDQEKEMTAYIQSRARLDRIQREALIKEGFRREEAIQIIISRNQEDPIIELMRLRKELLEVFPEEFKS